MIKNILMPPIESVTKVFLTGAGVGSRLKKNFTLRVRGGINFFWQL